MSKADFIKYIIENGYEYCETSNRIDISKITDELENIDESITLDKNDNEILLWTTENGSGKAHTLNKFELTVLKVLDGWIGEKNG
jgi:predicted secreted acid phosphatase